MALLDWFLEDGRHLPLLRLRFCFRKPTAHEMLTGFDTASNQALRHRWGDSLKNKARDSFPLNLG